MARYANENKIPYDCSLLSNKDWLYFSTLNSQLTARESIATERCLRVEDL